MILPVWGGFSSCFSRVSVRIRVWAGTFNMCVIKINLRGVVLSRLRFRGKIGNLWDPVFNVPRLPPFLMYSMCGEFKVSGDSF